MIYPLKNIPFLILLLCLQLLSLTLITVNAQQNSAPLIKSETNAARNLKIFDELWTKVDRNYFDPNFNGVDWAKMREIYRPRAEKAESKESLLAVLRQMLGELKTSHLAVWLVVDERKLEGRVLKNVDRKRDSIWLSPGFNVKIIGEQTIVTDVEDNTSAKAAGVQKGWILTAVNNKSPDEGFNSVEMREGQKIDYRFLDDKNRQYDFSLEIGFTLGKSERISRSLNENIGYLKFDGFTPGVGDWMQQEMAKFKQFKTVIVDLRDNGGGLVSEAKNTLKPFFAKDTEFGTFIERRGKSKEQKIKGSGDKAFTGKVIVLVDENSYSASEIFSVIMQENKRALIVGTKTTGQVLLSRQFNLPDNVKLRLPFGGYLSPKGVRLEKSGVKPDVEIQITVEEIRAGRDPVLEQAVRIVE